MDLSAVIFVALALAWAVYLIPKALKHHDEMASDRLVEGHSDKVRILRRKGNNGRPEVVEVETETVDTVERTTTEPRAVTPTMTRASARKAAQRRRRVLGVLVLVLAVVWTLTWFAYLPIWAPAVPGVAVVLWLVVTRLSVRRQQQPRRRPVRTEVTTTTVSRSPQVEARADAPAEGHLDGHLVERLTEDTVGVPRQELEAALADDGSLWDPLPMTLPTYVNKARARRTVRTIELTGINSSGHDQADTDLAREAEDTARESAREGTETDRKAAGA